MKHALSRVPALFALSLLPLACGGASEPKTAQVPAELARLVPPDAILYAHVASMDGLDAAIEALATALPEDAATELRAMDPFEFLLQGDRTLIDRSRPLGIAVAMPEIPTLLVPCSDPQAYATSLAAQPGTTSAVEGGYVGFSPMPDYAAAEGPSPLVSGLPAGTVSLRVDLAAVLESTRPMIDQGLNDLREQMARDLQGMPEMMGMDVGLVMDMYLDGIVAILDSAESLEYSLDIRDGTLELLGNLVVRQGSALDGFGAGDAVDVIQLASRLDYDEPAVAVMAMDMEKIMEPLEPFLDQLVGMYPESMRDAMAIWMTSYEELLPMIGNGVSLSGGFGAQGMQLAYHFDSPDPEGLLAGYRDLAARASAEAEADFFGPPVQETFEGVELTRYRMDLLPLLGEAGAESAETETFMQNLFGEDGLEFAMAGGDDSVTMVLGGDEAYLRGALDRIDGGGAVPADFARALERIEGQTPAMVMRIDMTSIVQGAFSLAGSMGAPVPGLPEDLPGFHTTIHFAVDGREWRGGMALQLDQLKAFTAALDEAFQ